MTLREIRTCLAAMAFTACSGTARADIFEWEWIDPLDPSQGKQQSTTLAPDGAGVDAVPGANLQHRNLTMAYLIGANLANASFNTATLTDADFTGADVRGADLRDTISRGFTAGQLYSTASYQAQDLTGIRLGNNDLTGWSFAGQNLTGANFLSATVTDADFTGAEVRGASFSSTTSRGFTAAQLYSTASYQALDLTGILLGNSDLKGWNFAGQKLTNASFSFGTLTDADLSGADARGAIEFHTSRSINTNLIRPDGRVDGADLTAGRLLVVRDYDGDPARLPTPIDPIAILIDEHFTMDASGTLRLLLEEDAWDSLISFAPGISVTLGGTLELDFAPGVDVASQIGRTIRIFDWTGVDPVDEFTVASHFGWNLSNLYTTGEITLAAVTAIPGDFNHDGIVDAADYTVWRDRGSSAQEFNDWKDNFGASSPGTGAGSGSSSAFRLPPSALDTAVPEPASLALLLLAAVGTLVSRPAIPHCRVVANNRC